VSRGPTIRFPAHILLEKHMQELGLIFEPEFQFAKPRRWRADYWVAKKVNKFRAPISDDVALVEIEGAVYSAGRHVRGKGFEQDCIKYSTAAMLGYACFRFTTGQVNDGTAREFLKKWRENLHSGTEVEPAKP
jgi:hypothetical protein